MGELIQRLKFCIMNCSMSPICLTPNSRFIFCAGVSLNIHSFIHAQCGRMEGNYFILWHTEHILFRDYMVPAIWVKYNSDRQRGNLLPPLHGLLFLISSKGSFICTDRIGLATFFVTQVVNHWLEHEIAQIWIQQHTTPSVHGLPLSYILFLVKNRYHSL